MLYVHSQIRYETVKMIPMAIRNISVVLKMVCMESC